MPDNEAIARLNEHIAMTENRIKEIEADANIEKATKATMLAAKQAKLEGLREQLPKGQ